MRVISSSDKIAQQDPSFQNGKPHSDLQVERPVYKQEQLNQASYYEKPTTNYKDVICHKLKNCDPISCCTSAIPVLQWIRHYRWNRDLFSDIVSGITVAIMHIPQGMAYGLLGNVPPVVGIYMAFFPVLIYFFLGTSRHVSMGTFAIVCLMTGKVVSTYATDATLLVNGTAITDGPSYTPMQVATSVTFTVAIIQMVMYVLRLGVITTLLSETLVSGFTCACAFHVVASQLKDLLGLPIVKRRGVFSFIYTLHDSILAIPKANHASVSISLVGIVVMTLNNEIFKPWLSTKTKIPFPIELVAVLTGTITSYCFDFNGIYNVTNVGDIPLGLPEPAPPAFELIPHILLDCIVITLVSYTITMSMAFIFAHKDHYEINANQELLALSVSNFFGSFFSCIAITASLSRSMIQHAVGGVTQIASIVSCAILLVVLLWFGPFFETLPRCVLASIILVALKSMLLQCTMVPKYWRLSRWDAIVWMATFLTTILISIDIGLGVGFCIALLSLFIRGQVPYTCLLGVVPNTDLYLDCKRYKGVQEIPGIKIYHYAGALNFASVTTFKAQLFRKIGFDPSQVLMNRKRMEETGALNSASGTAFKAQPFRKIGFDLSQVLMNRKRMEETGAVPEEDAILSKCIIIDFSAITYIDPAGSEVLKYLRKDFEQVHVGFYIASCSGPVYETLKNCDKYRKEDSKLNVFPTVHDGVLYAKVELLKGKDV